MNVRALLVLSTTALAASARADEVVLTNGRTIEGKAVRAGEQVVVRNRTGEMRLDAKEVARIVPGPTKEDLYRERLAKTDAKDAAQQAALADWCRDQGLADLERAHLRAILAIDPEHETARARLGYIRYEGRWLTEAEYYAARGFVKAGREWISKEEAERRSAERDAKAALEAHTRTIRTAVTKMSSPLRKVRAEGKRSLQEYASTIGDAALGRFAADVARHYNECWRAVKAEWEASAATATTTVRATRTELKRPIPVIETSLGANSTPVRIQLPELSVVSIRTTVRIPVTIELDEE